MKALKALVIGMGVLIVIGVALIGYGLIRGKQAPQQAQMVSVAVGEPFTARVPVPPGARLEQVTASGDRVILRFSGSDGDRLVLLDARTGRLAGTVALVPDNP